MNQEIKAKWVEALRSGKYKQGKKRLRFRGDTYCCLGVLCDVMGAEWYMGGEGEDDSCYYAKFSEVAEASILPPPIREAADINEEAEGDLITMNDQGDSFSTIADHIETNL